MNSTWIRIGCACVGALVLVGCQQDRDAEADVTIAGGRLESVEERMSPRAMRVARAQFREAELGDAEAVVSSSGETYYATEVGNDRTVIFDDDGVAWTEPIAAGAATDADVDVDVRVRPNQQME